MTDARARNAGRRGKRLGQLGGVQRQRAGASALIPKSILRHAQWRRLGCREDGDVLEQIGFGICSRPRSECHAPARFFKLLKKLSAWRCPRREALHAAA